MVDILMVFGSMEVLPYVLLGPAEEQDEVGKRFARLI